MIPSTFSNQLCIMNILQSFPEFSEAHSDFLFYYCCITNAFQKHWKIKNYCQYLLNNNTYFIFNNVFVYSKWKFSFSREVKKIILRMSISRSFPYE